MPLNQKWYKYNYSSEKYPAALIEKFKNPTI